MRTPEQDHAAIADFCNRLPTRPDAERVRGVLAAAFIEHIDALWPTGQDRGSPVWIAANVDSILATLERLYAMAATGEHPGDVEFLSRMAWLPALVGEIDHGRFDA